MSAQELEDNLESEAETGKSSHLFKLNRKVMLQQNFQSPSNMSKDNELKANFTVGLRKQKELGGGGDKCLFMTLLPLSYKFLADLRIYFQILKTQEKVSLTSSESVVEKHEF